MALFQHSQGPCKRKICKHPGTAHDDRSGCTLCGCVSYDPKLTKGNVLRASIAFDPWNRREVGVIVAGSGKFTVKVTLLEEVRIGEKRWPKGVTVEAPRSSTKFTGV